MANYSTIQETLDCSFYPKVTNSFKTRISVLIAFMAYVILISIACLAVNFVDSRRRGRSFWIYRTIPRASGRFICGNQQVIAPLMSIICAVVFLCHLVNEYQIFFLKAPQAHIYGLRIAPWTPVFIHAWTISFSSLQGFILTSRREKAMGFLTANVANGIFLGFGLVASIALIVLDAIVTNVSQEIWSEYLSITNYLTETQLIEPMISPAIELMIKKKFATLDTVVRSSVQYTIGLLCLFAVTPMVTGLVNIASLNLVLILRKQINFNFNAGQFGRKSRFDTRAGIDVDLERSVEVSFNDYQVEGIEVVLDEKPEIDEKRATGKQDDTTSVVLPTLEHSLSKKRSLSFRMTARPTLESIQLTQIAPKAVDLIEMELEESEDGYRVNLTRRKIRKLAKSKGDLEAYNHLNDLLRAEKDLIVTGTNILVLSLAFIALTIWVAVRLQRSVETDVYVMGFPEFETSLFAGHWLYACFVSLALSINLHTGITHLRQNILRSSRLNERQGSDFSLSSDVVRAASIGGGRFS